jgi:hypothetical protein
MPTAGLLHLIFNQGFSQTNAEILPRGWIANMQREELVVHPLSSRREPSIKQ